MNPLPLEAKQAVWALCGYVPSDNGDHEDQITFHKGMAKIKEAAGGEGGGKSYSVAMEMLPYMLQPDFVNKGFHFHLIGLNFKESRYEFDYLLDNLRKICPDLIADLSMPDQNKWRLEVRIMIKNQLVSINTLETISADDPLAIRGFESDMAAICEAGRVNQDVFFRVLGRLSRNGGILLISGTFEGSLGWYPQYWTMGQAPNDIGLESYSIPTYANRVKFPGGRQDPKILMLERQYPPDVFSERVMAKPTPPSDRVHKLFDPKLHVVSDEALSHLDREAPLFLAMDPGRTYAYAVLVIQLQSDLIYVTDEVYERDLLTREVVAIAKQQPWWWRVSETGNVIDIAGTYKQIASPPEVETWRVESGLNLHFEASKVDIEDGIRKLDSFLMPHPISREPKIYISSRCKGLIGELGGGPAKFENGGIYRRNLKVGSESYGRPIDANNHAVKALSYFLINHFGHAEVNRNRYAEKRAPQSEPVPTGRYWR